MATVTVKVTEKHIQGAGFGEKDCPTARALQEQVPGYDWLVGEDSFFDDATRLFYKQSKIVTKKEAEFFKTKKMSPYTFKLELKGLSFEEFGN